MFRSSLLLIWPVGVGDDVRIEAKGTIIEVGEVTYEGAWAVKILVSIDIRGTEVRDVDAAMEDVTGEGDNTRA